MGLAWIDRAMPAAPLAPLVDKHDVYFFRDPGELHGAGARKIEGLGVLLTTRVDADLLERVPALKVVANMAVGYDNIDLTAAKERGVIVTNTPDVLTESTADLTWALILAVARNVVWGDNLVRAGRFEGWSPSLLLGLELSGKLLGIAGSGRIGSAVARRAVGFGMRICYFDEYPNERLERELGARRVAMEDLLRESDVVSIHLPLSDDTRHLFDEQRLRRMKPQAVLVNTARGPIIDEAALVRVLADGHLYGAGLDVYEREPELAEGLAALPNVTLLPHVGSATVEARNGMARLVGENILAVLDGREAPNRVA
jgi:glyoxylate reductase